jgi:hypothetical protein
MFRPTEPSGAVCCPVDRHLNLQAAAHRCANPVSGDDRVNSTDLLIEGLPWCGREPHEGRSLDFDLVVRRWRTHGITRHPPAAPASSDWRGEYYNNTSLSGGAAATRQDGPVLAFAWPDVPVAGVNADYFSVRWTMTLESAGGAYQFNTRHDDGARLYIDGTLVLDTWWDQMPPRTA